MAKSSKSAGNSKSSGKRALIEPRGDKRHIGRDVKGRIAESSDQGKSLSKNVKQLVKANLKPVYSDEDDQRLKVAYKQQGQRYKIRVDTEESHVKENLIKSKFPTDSLVYINKAGQASVEFNKEGTPVHEISFEEKLDVIQRGFFKEQLLELKDRYGISLKVMANILNITDRSIQNKPKRFKFTGNIAEKMLGLSEIYSYGIEVFEERDKFRKWLDTPNPVLNNKRPVELFLTQLGMQQVRQELARIDYGIY